MGSCRSLVPKLSFQPALSATPSPSPNSDLLLIELVEQLKGRLQRRDPDAIQELSAVATLHETKVEDKDTKPKRTTKSKLSLGKQFWLVLQNKWRTSCNQERADLHLSSKALKQRYKLIAKSKDILKVH